MTFAPLRQPGFRMLWLVWLSANLTMWMSDVTSTWLMTSLNDSPFMVAMVQSASTLPLFLLGLPSGALADMLDRRRYLVLTQLWAGAVAVVLAALSFSGALNATALLVCTFLNGIGMAMRWPLFAAIVPDLVSREDLPGALALNGIAANLSRIVGPLIAGALQASVGSAWVYLLNAVVSMAVLAPVLRWQPTQKATQPSQALFAAMRQGLRHVAQSAQLRIILWRIFLFFLQASALTALLPLVALHLAGDQPSAFTTLLVALAAGGVLMAFNLHHLRRHASRDTTVAVGTCVHALASSATVLAPSMWLAALAVVLAGMAWIATANSLTVAMQLSLPDWVRARGMSIYLMAVMGGSAAGAAAWGALASCSSVRSSVLAASSLGVVVFLLTRRHSVDASD